MNLTRFIGNLKFLSRDTKLALYPPFWVMGIKVLELEQNPVRLRLLLPLNWRSRNTGGSMFGGFQAAVADPIAPMACLMAFPGYHVWTRHMAIDFILPGNSDLELRFTFDDEQLEQVRKELAERGRATPTFEYGLYRSDGQRCSVVHCTVAIREEGYAKK